MGGPWGYGDFLITIRDPKHEDHDNMLEWIGGKFDPEEFSAEAATKDMRRGLPNWRNAECRFYLPRSGLVQPPLFSTFRSHRKSDQSSSLNCTLYPERLHSANRTLHSTGLLAELVVETAIHHCLTRCAGRPKSLWLDCARPPYSWRVQHIVKEGVQFSEEDYRQMYHTPGCHLSSRSSSLHDGLDAIVDWTFDNSHARKTADRIQSP